MEQNSNSEQHLSCSITRLLRTTLLIASLATLAAISPLSAQTATPETAPHTQSSVPDRHVGIKRWSNTTSTALARDSLHTTLWSFEAFGQVFSIEAEPNTALLQPLSTDQRTSILAENNLLRGKLVGNGESWVRLNETPEGVAGMIWDGREYWVIEPMPASAGRAQRGSTEVADTVIFPFSEINSSFTCGVTGDEVGMSTDDPMDVEHLTELVRGNAQAALLPLQVVVVTDQFWDGDTFGTFNIVDGIYREQVGVGIQIASVEQADFNSSSGDGLLTEFSRYLGNRSRIGIGHLLTGRNLNRVAGIAFLDALCGGTGLSTQGRSVVTIVAHEIGHNFGARHDQNTGCANGSIMDAFVSGSRTFSSCSISTMSRSVAEAACLSDGGNNGDDFDGDGIPDVIDPDDDNDGVNDDIDAFPLDPNETVDTDNDGVGNNTDSDDDNDGFPDVNDAFPLDPAEWSDSDGDGIGDNADTDTGACNLIDNGSLNENTSGWLTNTTLSITDDAVTGSAMTWTGGVATTAFNALGNRRYSFSGYAKSTTGNGWAGLGIDFLDAAGTELGELVQSVRPASEYARFTLTGIAPSGTTRARLWVYAGGTRSIFVDELLIEPGNLIPNGNFETSSAGWFSNTTPVLTQDSSVGQQALQFSDGTISLTVAAPAPGSSISFSADYKSTDSSAWSGVGIDYLNASGEEIGEEVMSLQPASSYRTKTFSGSIPSDTRSIRLWIFTPSSRILTLDNVKIVENGCSR